MLVRHWGVARGHPPAPAPAVRQARDTLATTAARRRAQRSALWQDSSFFQDSFFAPDSRDDPFGGSEFSSLSGLFPKSAEPAGKGADPLAGQANGADDVPGTGSPAAVSSTRH